MSATSVRSLDRTLEELEGERWGEATYPSHLVNECHRLRTVPLRLFTIENLRIMLGQNIGPRFWADHPDLRDTPCALRIALATPALFSEGR